jgi:uncharacterized membrane protein
MPKDDIQKDILYEVRTNTMLIVLVIILNLMILVAGFVGVIAWLD